MPAPDHILKDREGRIAPEREPVKEPARRWVNWWRKTASRKPIAICSICGVGTPVATGDVIRSHCGVYPSKEIAEEKAADSIRAAALRGRRTLEYVGAHPEPSP